MDATKPVEVHMSLCAGAKGVNPVQCGGASRPERSPRPVANASVRLNIRPNNAVRKRLTVSHLVPVDRPAPASDQPERDTVGRPATPCDKLSPTCNRQVVGSSPAAGSERLYFFG